MLLDHGPETEGQRGSHSQAEREEKSHDGPCGFRFMLGHFPVGRTQNIKGHEEL